MEKNYSSTDHSAGFDRALSLPHFDEEATLLSARPVVPLNEVKAVTRSSRRGIFALTILAAVLVGAIGATLLRKGGQDSQTTLERDASQTVVVSSGAAGGSISAPSEAKAPVRELAEEPPPGEVPSVRDLSIKKRQSTAISHSSTKPTFLRDSVRPVRAPSPDDERTENTDSDERDSRRAERRDERREAGRQRRERRDQIDNDVLRIREIFEGSPRP